LYCKEKKILFDNNYNNSGEML